MSFHETLSNQDPPIELGTLATNLIILPLINGLLKLVPCPCLPFGLVSGGHIIITCEPDKSIYILRGIRYSGELQENERYLLLGAPREDKLYL